MTYLSNHRFRWSYTDLTRGVQMSVDAMRKEEVRGLAHRVSGTFEASCFQ